MIHGAGAVLAVAAFCACAPPLADAQQAAVETAQGPEPADLDRTEGSSRETLEATIGEWNRREDVDFDAAVTRALVEQALAVEREWLASNRAKPQEIRRASPVALHQYLRLLAAETTPQERGEVPKLESLLAEELGRGGAFVPERNRYAALAVVVDPSHCGSTTVVDDQPLQPMDCAGEHPRRRVIVTTAGEHIVVVERDGHSDCRHTVNVPADREREVACAFPE
jgi:hypothetical protein